MRQWNNVTDHTLEVDRDQDRIRSQEETCGSGLCAPPLANLSQFSTVKKKDWASGRVKLEMYVSWLQYNKAVTLVPLLTNQTKHKKVVI